MPKSREDDNPPIATLYLVVFNVVVMLVRIPSLAYTKMRWWAEYELKLWGRSVSIL